MRLKGAKAGDDVEVWGVGASVGAALAVKTLTNSDLPNTTITFHVQKPFDPEQPVTVFVLARFDVSGDIKTRMKVVNLTPVNRSLPAPTPVVSFTSAQSGMNVSDLPLTRAEVVNLITEVLKNSLRLNVSVP